MDTLYIARHAHAEGGGPYASDGSRCLSERGRAACSFIGRALAERQVQWDLVLTSPLVRAVQTAELLAAAIDYKEVIVSLDSLAPDMPTGKMEEDIRGCAADFAAGKVLVVSHAPGVTRLGAHFSEPPFVAFAPGQVCKLENQKLEWVLDPDNLQFRQPA